MNKRYVCLLTLLSLLVFVQPASAVEPNMIDYEAMPIFSAQSTEPNVMIILDNSGSMNWYAYGTWNGSGSTVTDQPFAGEPYDGIVSVQISSSLDDMEENKGIPDNPYDFSDDLDFGGFGVDSDNTVVGLRFPGIEVPEGATITGAYIDFVAYRTEAAPTYLTIVGEDSGDAPPLDMTTDNIENRPAIVDPIGGGVIEVDWEPEPWEVGLTYQTPDLSAIVQEIVNRPDWDEGHAMVFRITGDADFSPNTGKRDARARNYGSASAPVLRIQYTGGRTTRYYGLFNPDYFYSYNSGRFQVAYKKIYPFNMVSNAWNVTNLSGTSSTLDSASIVANGLWDGNWLNWATMRRIDVLRKVLFGGDTHDNRDGSGVQNLYTEYDSSYWYRNFNSSGNVAVTPFHGNHEYRMRYGQIRVNDGGTYRYYDLVVEKNVTYEPEEFLNYDNGDNLAGIIQRIGNAAKWGNIWFRTGNSSGNHGGYLDNPVGADIVDIVHDLEAVDPSSWTPLAETFYVAMQYFRQEEPEISGYNALLNSTKRDADDPYFRDGQDVPCAKSFVIMLTDGASTMDAHIPSEYKDYDGDFDRTACVEYNNTDCDYPSYGTDFLDDLALYAHTEDLRPDMGYSGMGTGDYTKQTINLYTIYAFGNDDDARSLLRDAARNGGFKDRDGDNRPDGNYWDAPEDRLEWDANGDGEPDTYFEANDGYALEAKLIAAISDIMKQATSGTAASVLSTNTEGAGNSVQAYFRPLVTEGLEEGRWRGYLETLWVDPWGNLREDTTGNKTLDLQNSTGQNNASGNTDRIVEFVIGENGDTVARVYNSHFLYNPDNGKDYQCVVEDCDLTDYDEIPLDTVNPLFEAGTVLANRDISASGRPRKLFTYIGSTDMPTTDTTIDSSGDVVFFDTGMAPEIKPFLGLSDLSSTGKWDAYGLTPDERVDNLITYIQGNDVPGLRNRTLAGATWRLGDIVHSTPIVVARPAERFHQLYNDGSYAEFLAAYADRETMIYVGANDGMMHAFTNWVYTENSDGDPSYVAPAGVGSDEVIGDELWAYIPQSVLPHLKWYGSPEYTHTYFVDGEPRVFDANILPDETHYSDSDNEPNFGTFMVFGMGMGAKSISVDEDFGGGVTTRTFSPTYVLMDITEPRSPRLMWERTYDNLGMSYSVPAPVRVGDRWFLVFGSGPTEYDGQSDNGGYIYVVDLETGEPIGSGGNDWLYGEIRTVDAATQAGNGYFNDALVLDVFQTANADAIYLANNYYNGNGWSSDILKITVPCYSCAWDGYTGDNAVYDDEPTQWQLSTLFYSDRPVTVKLATSTDEMDNVLVYFGTGRYLSKFDLFDDDQQYMYGIKDPFYNRGKYDGMSGNYYHNFGSSKAMERDDLFETDDIEVTTNGYVLGWKSEPAEFSQFVNYMRWSEDGWYLSLIRNGNLPSERIITRSAILGGIVLTPTFTPNSDVCGMGGDTQLLGLYYETGTGYTSQIFDIDEDNLRTQTVTLTNPDGSTSSSTEELVEIRNDNLLKGTPAPKIVFHVGLEGGATSKLQMSNRGEGGSPTDTLYFRSMITEWWDYQE